MRGLLGQPSPASIRSISFSAGKGVSRTICRHRRSARQLPPTSSILTCGRCTDETSTKTVLGSLHTSYIHQSVHLKTLRSHVVHGIAGVQVVWEAVGAACLISIASAFLILSTAQQAEAASLEEQRSNVPSMGPAGAEPSPGIDAAWQEAAGIAFKQDGLLDLSGRSSEDEAADLEEGKELIREVWEVISLKYADVRGGGFSQDRWAQLRDEALKKPLKDQAATYRAIRVMLAEGITDRFTRFVPREQFSSMNSYDITGVGINISTASELEDKTDFQARQPGLYVLGLINQSAARKAGIAQGDQILDIDGVPVKDQSPFEAAALIQGGNGETSPPPVSIKVRKAKDDAVVGYTLPRAARNVEPSPVSFKLVKIGNRKIGSIKLDKFVARSQPDVASAVLKLTDEGAEEFVLDLRNNLGGLVEEGVEVARLFLDGNVTIVNRLDNGGIQRRTASGSLALTDAPVTLLVNERTASASEIFAGALRDNCRAVLVGSRTYGKGLIQSVYQLEDGSALVVTIGKYLTPARIDIDREGLRPDFGSIPERNEAAAKLDACKARFNA